jgi:hypothetical protein
MSSIIAHRKRNFKSALADSHIVQQFFAPDRIEQHCREVGHRWRASFWSPAVTLLTCLLQALNSVKSLRAAVADLLGQLAMQEGTLPLPSADPSAFAQARQRVPTQVFHAILREVTQHVQGQATVADHSWRGFQVILIDGVCVSMPDTPQLQRRFPQPKGQSPGCGFPMARLVTLFDWRSGAVIDHRIGSQHDGEAALFRQMLDHFQIGTVALADRHYCSYVDIARLVQRGSDVVFRNHQRRSHDFRTGFRLGDHDCLVTWHRPTHWLPSFGISPEEFQQLPDQLTLRMVRTTRAPRGFRSRRIVIITTILDPAEASADELLALYRDRWMVELNLRSLKTTLGMETLRGRSVDVIHKEIVTHLLLYNLIRLLIWEATRATNKDPQRLSFAGTLHRLQSTPCMLLIGSTARIHTHQLLTHFMEWIAGDALPYRPDRCEPRRVKRRPKQYSRLIMPRAHYHRHGDHSCR